MKAKPGRLADLETGKISSFRPTPGRFGPRSLVWQLTTAGITASTALGALLRQAGLALGEQGFPYSQVAQALLDQQLAVFEGVGMQLSHTPGLARRWGQAVWLDWQVRQRLENRHLKSKCTRDALYVESLRFAGLMGLSPQRLPVTLAEFDAWAEYSLQAWPASGYQGMALECVTGLTPVFWPANLALILYLLPETFWGRYGAGLELEGRKLAGQVRGMMEVLSEL